MPTPRTAIEFTEYFAKSPLSQASRDDIASYEEEFAGQESTVQKYIESVQAGHAQG